MSLHESAEMYLETIYQLSLEHPSVRSIDVAEALNYSRPSVSRAVGLLKQDGYLTMDDVGFLHLTDLGRSTAEKIYERHTVLTAALMALGVDQTLFGLEGGIAKALVSVLVIAANYVLSKWVVFAKAEQ